MVNLDFLEHSETSRTHVILDDMREMGEFICMKAQIEHRCEGVEAEIAVREGGLKVIAVP